MDPTTSPSLSLMSLFAPLVNSPDSLQNNAIFAENAGGETTGLFASLLSQLTPDQPATAPASGETAAVLPAIVPVIAVETLPPAGKVLPLPASPVVIEEQGLPISVTLADTAEQVAALPLPGLPGLPGLPQATQGKPLASTASITTSLPAATALTPAVAAVVAKPEPAKPLTSTTPVTTDRLQPLDTDTTEQKIVIDSRSTTALSGTREIPVNMTAQSNLQPLPTVTADNPTAFGTTAPLATQPLSSTPTPQQAMTLNHPVADARWGDALGQRVIWMTENGMGRAEIKLNPPELGPLHIRLSVVNDEAKVAFSVQHGTTRDLVEAALPRLREMFAEQGIELTDASVSQHSPGDRQQTGETGNSSHNSSHDDAQLITDIDEIDAMATNTIIREGLIDTYA